MTNYQSLCAAMLADPGDMVLRRALADRLENGAFVANSRGDVPYLLDLLVARDKELTELRGMLADLCEDGRAAAAAVRYRRALEQVTITKFVNEYWVWWDADAMYRIAAEALEGASP